jgi:glutathionyl-hydroquinone reductase
LKEDYEKCIEALKIYILEEPNNIKYRFQYAYAYEKRVKKLFEEEKNIEEIKLSEQYLKISKKIF